MPRVMMFVRFLLVLMLAFGQLQGQLQKPIRQFDIDPPTPLIAAIGQIGMHVSSGYVSFGIDLRISDSEPKVRVHLNTAANVNDALLQLVQQLPGYTFEPISEHLVDIYKAGTLGDSQDVLATRVAKFEVKDEPPANILSNPPRFIPELQIRLEPLHGTRSCVLGPGLGSAGPGITLSLENVTVREILNKVSEASSALAEQASSPAVVPLGWIHILHVAKPGTQQSHEWRFYSTTPKDWRPKIAPGESAGHP